MEGDEAVYYMLNEDRYLDGMVLIHVDDLYLGGRTSFVEEVTKNGSLGFDVSQVEDDHFMFTGNDVRKVEDGIEISMEDCSRSLEEV